MPEVMSTRLFPKYQGADAVRITGVAARCDWVVVSDHHAPHVRLERRTEGPPRTVFLSLRSPVRAFEYFVEQVLPMIDRAFVLVSGSEDVTVPTQLDRRWPPYDEATQSRIATILGDHRVRRWHAENLDRADHPRLVPLPLGYVWPEGPDDVRWPPEPPPATGAREVRVLCAHRVRDGAQWEPRRAVDRLAHGPWRAWCTTPDRGLDEAGYEQLLRTHAFVLCVEGGGLDPSPKAWQAISHGAIPVIRRTPLAPAYAELPVAFVDAWTADAITPAKLAAWHRRFAPEHDDPARRRAVLERLTLDWWWARVLADAA